MGLNPAVKVPVRRVLIICNTDILESKGAAYSRYYNYSVALRRSGVEVVLVSFLNPLRLNSEKVVDCNGIEFYGSRRSGYPAMRKISRRMVFILQFYYNAVILIKGLYKSRVILWAPKDLFTDVVACVLYRFLCGIRIVCEKNERFIGIVINNRVTRYGTVLNSIVNGYLYIMASLQDDSIRFYSHVIAISSNMYTWAVTRNSHVTMIPIIIDANYANYSKKVVGKVLKIGFFGTIDNEKEGIFDFIDVLRQFDNSERFEFDLYGFISDTNKQILYDRSREHKNTITYKGVLSNIEAIKKMRDYDVLVLPRRNNLQCSFGFSTKLGEYLLAGRAVLVSDVSDNGRYIRSAFNGFIFEAGETESLSKNIRLVFDMIDVLPEIGQRGLHTALENFSLDTQTASITNAVLGVS